jgi:hypothetical protein
LGSPLSGYGPSADFVVDELEDPGQGDRLQFGQLWRGLSVVSVMAVAMASAKRSVTSRLIRRTAGPIAPGRPGRLAFARAGTTRCLLQSFAFEWLFITMLMRPLIFASSAYVPVSTMPSWLRAIANHQPVTAMVDAVRWLAEGARVEAVLHHSTADYVGLTLAWSAGLIAVFSALAIARFARR